jgi:outer membrane protein assembly factor BamB
MWKADTLGSVTTPPNVAEGVGVLFVGTDQGWVHAFGMGDGGEWWRAQASGKIVGLANDGGRLYATSADGNVYAWEMGSGASIWVLNTGSELGAAPLTDGGSVLVGTTAGEIRYIEASGGQELTDLKLTLHDAIYYTPAPAGGWLFVQASKVYGIGP